MDILTGLLVTWALAALVASLCFPLALKWIFQ